MPALSEYPDRCPSPPSDYENDETDTDQLGDFSRTELIRLFLRLQKYMTSNTTEVGEEDICNVWDAVNCEEVADFFMENDILNVLLVITERSHDDDRLGEICAGILANLITSVSIEHLKNFVETCEVLLYIFFRESDPLNLHQIMRFFQVCLVRSPSDDSAMAPIVRQKAAFVSKCSFILSNCTNSLLLNDVLYFIERDTDLGTDIFTTTSELIDAIFSTFESLLETFEFSHMTESEDSLSIIMRVLSDMLVEQCPLSPANINFLLHIAYKRVHAVVMENAKELTVIDISNFFDNFLYLIGTALLQKTSKFDSIICLEITLDLAQFFTSSGIDYTDTQVVIKNLLKTQVKILTKFKQFETFVPDNSAIEKKLLENLSS